MNTQRSAVALRFIIVSAVSGVDGDSLDQLNSAQIPDGAYVSIASTGVLYRYSLSSTASTTNNGGAVVAPPNGVGRYIIQLSSSGDPRNVQVTGTAALTGATSVTDDTWIATPSGANFYAAANEGAWTGNTTTGLATWSGPVTQILARGIASLASSVAAQSLELAFSLNGAGIGTTGAFNDSAVASVPPTTAGLAISLVTQRIVTVGPGSTLQLMMRDTSASNTITLSKLNVILTAA
jgi:hypothetical protein